MVKLFDNPAFGISLSMRRNGNEIGCYISTISARFSGVNCRKSVARSATTR